MLPPDPFLIPECTPLWAYNKWHESNQVRHLYPSMSVFHSYFSKPDSIALEGPGILIRIADIVRGWKASIHGCVYSHEPYRYIGQIHELGSFVMDSFDLLRLEAQVPAHFRGVNRFLQKIGFIYEGTLQNGGKKSTMIYDVNVWRFNHG